MKNNIISCDDIKTRLRPPATFAMEQPMRPLSPVQVVCETLTRVEKKYINKRINFHEVKSSLALASSSVQR